VKRFEETEAVCVVGFLPKVPSEWLETEDHNARSKSSIEKQITGIKVMMKGYRTNRVEGKKVCGGIVQTISLFFTQIS
jgi:hypothetical protein